MTDELKRESERFVKLAAQATPGQWGIEGRNWSHSIENCEGYGVASVHVHPQDYRNRKADADFIAAAPDMAAHIAKLQAILDGTRAKLDALMMEHCPDEMTPGPRDRWAASQASAMERQS